ncbi:hypothetical protein [Rhodanobacter hydrolyticus]|uniref:Uncharacterized protein n=1 Tax=Rhodanobacter hydrolyticus TaxID=2250595 RepID=A0ABW8J4W5_9GAMM
MKILVSALLVATVTLISYGPAYAAPFQNQGSNSSAEKQMLLAQKTNLSTALIKNQGELQRFMQSNYNNADNPLNKLPAAARMHFVDSLVFRSEGLASFSYDDLRNLSVTDAYRILSLFGAQDSIGSIPNIKPVTDVDYNILAASPQLYPPYLQDNICGSPSGNGQYNCVGARSYTCNPNTCH